MYAIRQKSVTAPISDLSDRKEFNWAPIIYYYCIYIGIIFFGHLIGFYTNAIGGAIFLLLLYSTYWKHLSELRFDLLVACIFSCLLLQIIPLVSFDQQMLLYSAQEIIKYNSLFFTMIIALCLPFTPLSRSKDTRPLYITLFVFLVVGWLLPIAQGIHEARVKGFLANANNFALTAFMFYFITDFDRAGTLKRAFTHFIVLFFIYISRTSGAIFGYIVGMFNHFIRNRKNGSFSFGRFISVLLVSLIALVILISVPAGILKPVDISVNKIRVIKENAYLVWSGRRIDYGEIKLKTKEDVSSGLWRIYHWTKVLNYCWDAPLVKQFFGHGIGTSDIIFKSKPHNDYVRMLFETGLVGLVLNLLIWIILYHRMAVQYRWIVLMIAFYSITENNYDHFPAMSLLVFYMISSGKQIPKAKTVQNTF